MNLPAVSIIIPVFNTEPYLTECLESVQRQTLHDWEAICVDDGSNDQSPVLLQKFAENDSRFHIYSQKNRGPSEARNNGLLHASGKYIFFLDSDDLIDDQTLQRLYDLAENHHLDLLRFSAKPFNTPKRKRATENCFEKQRSTFPLPSLPPSTGSDILHTLLTTNTYSGSACFVFYNHNFLKKHLLLFSPSLRTHEDELFTFYCWQLAEKAAALPNGLYGRRIRKESTMQQIGSSAQKFEQSIKDRLFIFRQEIEFLKRQELSAESFIFFTYSHIVRNLFTIAALKKALRNPANFTKEELRDINTIFCIINNKLDYETPVSEAGSIIINFFFLILRRWGKRIISLWRNQ